MASDRRAFLIATPVVALLMLILTGVIYGLSGFSSGGPHFGILLFGGGYAALGIVVWMLLRKFDEDRWPISVAAAWNLLSALSLVVGLGALGWL